MLVNQYPIQNYVFVKVISHFRDDDESDGRSSELEFHFRVKVKLGIGDKF